MFKERADRATALHYEQSLLPKLVSWSPSLAKPVRPMCLDGFLGMHNILVPNWSCIDLKDFLIYIFDGLISC